jgi:hypothetical protein
VIPSYSGCLEQIQAVAVTNKEVTDAQIAIESKINEYYQAALGKKIYATATILDPRFKVEYFKGRRDCASVKKQFFADAERFSTYSRGGGQDEDRGNWVDQMFKKPKKANLQEEIKTYLSEPLVSKESDPLVYWIDHKRTFPSLSVMAMKYLSICATSAPSERAFSGGRQICNYTRGSLSPEKLTATMCLKSWLSNGFGL